MKKIRPRGRGHVPEFAYVDPPLLTIDITYQTRKLHGYYLKMGRTSCEISCKFDGFLRTCIHITRERKL